MALFQEHAEMEPPQECVAIAPNVTWAHDMFLSHRKLMKDTFAPTLYRRRLKISPVDWVSSDPPWKNQTAKICPLCMSGCNKYTAHAAEDSSKPTGDVTKIWEKFLRNLWGKGDKQGWRIRKYIQTLSIAESSSGSLTISWEAEWQLQS